MTKSLPRNRKNNIRRLASFLGIGALGFSLRRSQRDPDFRGEIIYVPVMRSRCGVKRLD
jgi:hypothetical protein